MLRQVRRSTLRSFCFSCRYRFYTAVPVGGSVMNVFDRKAKRRQKNRAAMDPEVAVYDYIKDEVASRLCDRVNDISRHFPLALDLGCGRGYLARHLEQRQVGTLVCCDMSDKMLEQCEVHDVPILRAVVDEESFPFKPNTFDMIASSLSLHWVNDLPGTFQQIIHSLKSDGVFLGAMFGGETLFQLRCALQLAETEREGGFAPHISPFTEMRDLGNLLTRAGFSLTTVDFDEITIGYPSIFELMCDLKGMGENCASWSRKSILHRDTLLTAAAIYKDMYGLEDGTIPATFQILYMIGWKPDGSQPKPLQRGSGTASFQDLDSLNKPDS